MLYRWLYRDARTGQFVTKEYAEDPRNKGTTVRERCWFWQNWKRP